VHANPPYEGPGGPAVEGSRAANPSTNVGGAPRPTLHLMRRRLPTLTPRQYATVTLAALVLLYLIVLSGAAVRLTGSGLGCTGWPRCGDSVIAPLETHAMIEFGNRIVTGLVGIPCVLAFLLSLRRSPRRRDLVRLSALLPLGVLAQAVLGGLTVIFELRPGFVMGHFLLSMLILACAVALFWRARHEPGTRPVNDRRVVLATRSLLGFGGLALFAGTLATAAGPHPGSAGTGEVVGRIDWISLDAFIHWHGRTGTLLGLAAVATWFLARRRGADAATRRALTALCLLVAAQGLIGFAQYELDLPAELVWLHIVVASGAWLSIVFANVAVGRPAPRPVPHPGVPAPADRHEPVAAGQG
jgi:cytochrome c oxidase assembly protein subunit 15